LAVLESRLVARGTETADKVKVRMAAAVKEVAEAHSTPGLFQVCTVCPQLFAIN
jgi:guanylate kinase